MKRWAAILLLLLLPVFGCQSTEPLSSAVGYACDTVVTIRAYAPQETVDDAMRLIRDYERVLSKTVEGSDVWRLNHADGQPTEVNPETAELLRLALDVAENSGGAFQSTIAPLSALWDFQAETPTLPDADALQTAAKLVDDGNVLIDGNTVTLRNGATLDLGGVAKGYIADCAAAYLRSQGVTHACINMGGNVLVFGGKPDGTDWTIGIRDPNGTAEQSEETVRLSDGAVVTSGNYERCFELDGVRYHHILDPKTGMPVQNGVASVTILCERSALADALSTACFVLGPKASEALLQQYGARAVFLFSDGSRIEIP